MEGGELGEVLPGLQRAVTGDDRLAADGALTDLRLLVRGEKPAPDLITIVAIDDDTAAKKGGYPLPRTELARLLEEIARFEPRLVAIDLLMVDRGSDTGDAALAEALQKRPGLLAAAAVFGLAAGGTGWWLWRRGGRQQPNEYDYGGITCSEVQKLVEPYRNGTLAEPQRSQQRRAGQRGEQQPVTVREAVESAA